MGKERVSERNRGFRERTLHKELNFQAKDFTRKILQNTCSKVQFYDLQYK